MKFRPIVLAIVLGAGAPLLIAAQDAPEAAAEPAESAAPEKVSQAFPEAAAATVTPGEAGEVPAESATPPAEAAEPAPEPAPEPAGAASEIAVPAKGKPPTHAFMVGVWTENLAKCATALDFKADGKLIGPFPRWELSEEGELTMVGNRQKIMLTVVDRNTMQSRRAKTDPPRTLKRCPAPEPVPTPTPEPVQAPAPEPTPAPTPANGGA